VSFYRGEPEVRVVTEVVVLRWPEERDELDRLADQRVPRLLLVEASADPPIGDDLLEDWVRLPSEDRDVRARLITLRRRAAEVLADPVVDRHGRLVWRGAWAHLSPIEERLAARLSSEFNLIVSEEALLKHGWPDAPPSSNALRVHLHRLRQRIRPLGLEVRGVRSQGWILQSID
jgi:DNA-binding response OmpR family regulator